MESRLEKIGRIFGEYKKEYDKRVKEFTYGNRNEFTKFCRSPLGRLAWSYYRVLKADESGMKEHLEEHMNKMAPYRCPVNMWIVSKVVGAYFDSEELQDKWWGYSEMIKDRKMSKKMYEYGLSKEVGKPITVEEYEREFGFLKGGNDGR